MPSIMEECRDGEMHGVMMEECIEGKMHRGGLQRRRNDVVEPCQALWSSDGGMQTQRNARMNDGGLQRRRKDGVVHCQA